MGVFNFYRILLQGEGLMYNSIKNKKIECLDSVHTIADGIAVKQPGDTFDLVSKYVDDIALVTDDEIACALFWR